MRSSGLTSCFRRTRRGLEQLLGSAGEEIDKNFLGRLGRVRTIWQFLAVWLLAAGAVLAGLLIQISGLRPYYQVLRPTPGGMYSEGMEGAFTTANPLYAVSDIDTSVSRLLFAGLLAYDSQNHLVGDLADRWTHNADGSVYTVHLRPGLRWHDGSPLTADDVVFTYQTIQNPDAQSPFLSSWQGVKVDALDEQTVRFTLPNPLSSFPYSLTNGIVPKHILADLNPADLRSAAFNTSDPVGAGPFQWKSIGVSGVDETAEEQIVLVPFAQYWAGAPKLGSFSIHAYAGRQALLNAYRDKEITSMVGVDELPKDIAQDKTSHTYSLPLTAGTYVFFKTTNPILKDAKVRQALVAGADRGAVIDSLGYMAIPVDEPLLKGQLGYDARYAQATGQPARAGQLLDAAGWRMGADGVRSRKGQPLAFVLAATDSAEYRAAAATLQKQWQALGARVTVQTLPADAFEDTLSHQSYDALLYGITIGADPDVFVYWDSSQSAAPLNFSNYSSSAADLALEAGRTRLGDKLRAVKYQTFLNVWRQDAPALGLYQPRLLYVSHVPVYGMGAGPINSDADRFNNVQNWMIHVGWVVP